MGIFRTIPTRQVGVQLRVLELENGFEGSLLGGWCVIECGFQVPLQKYVQLFHAAATAPFELGSITHDRQLSVEQNRSGTVGRQRISVIDGPPSFV